MLLELTFCGYLRPVHFLPLLLLTLFGCWPLGRAPKSKYAHPTPPYALEVTDSLNQNRIQLGGYQVVLSAEQPVCGKQAMKAHNNLDLTLFKGRFYLAWRNAPSHFASAKTRLCIASSSDLKHWTCEEEIHLGADLREPRFLVWRGRLILFFFEAGTKMLKFEPRHTYATHRKASGEWAEPTAFPELDGWVPWRVKLHNGRPLLSSYYGENLYNANHNSKIRLFTSDSLYSKWEPISAQPQYQGEAGEEAAFTFDEAGNMFGTIRREGFGGAVFRAPAGKLHQWKVKLKQRKYDSALMFRAHGGLYLLARRHPHPKPHGRSNSRRWNLLLYSVSAKRSALYRIHPTTLAATHLLDLPGKGDTAFAGITRHPIKTNTWVIANYTNPPEGPDYWWITGQLRPTLIYTMELRITPYG